jgi:hypothetical protein
VVSNSTLRYYAVPVGHICIVSEHEYACGWELGWEEGLGPWFGRVLGGPRLLAIAGPAVHKDDGVPEL